MYFQLIMEKIFSCLNIYEKEYYINATAGIQILDYHKIEESNMYQLSSNIFDYFYPLILTKFTFYQQVMSALRNNNNNLLVYLFWSNQNKIKHELCSCLLGSGNNHFYQNNCSDDIYPIHIDYFCQAIENESLKQFAFLYYQIKHSNLSSQLYFKHLHNICKTDSEFKRTLVALCNPPSIG